MRWPVSRSCATNAISSSRSCGITLLWIGSILSTTAAVMRRGKFSNSSLQVCFRSGWDGTMIFDSWNRCRDSSGRRIPRFGRENPVRSYD